MPKCSVIACPVLTYSLFSQGSGAYKAKVKFPEDKDVMERTVLVGDMNPLVTLEQVPLYVCVCKRH